MRTHRHGTLTGLNNLAIHEIQGEYSTELNRQSPATTFNAPYQCQSITFFTYDNLKRAVMIGVPLKS